MANLDKKSKTFLTGAVLGGIIGICAVALCKREKKDKSAIQALGDAVIQMGEILNTAKTPALHQAGKKIHKHEEEIADVVELISSGMKLWEKLRKEA